MEFPSIKLNILKKLEYFLEFKELDKRFDSQFEILINQKTKWNNEENKYKNCAYPSWEIEKKILFWTYAYHKHLGRSLKKGHFKDMFIAYEEYNKIGVARIFENLELGGFGEKKVEKNKDERLEDCFYINQKGLSYGELLWYLYKLKKFKIKNNIPPQGYCDVFKTPYKLTHSSCGTNILNLQYYSLIFLTIFTGLFFTFELLEKIGLLNNLKDVAINYVYYPNFWIMLIMLPIVFFSLSIVLDVVYKYTVVRNKYKSVEKLKA